MERGAQIGEKGLIALGEGPTVGSRVERGAQIGEKGLIAFRGRVGTNTTEVSTGVTVRFSEGPFFRRFIVPKVHCSEGSLFRKKGLLCRRFIGPKGHLSEIGVHCFEGSLFRRFIVLK